MVQKRIGNIIVPPGSYPTKHEKVTVDYLAKALGVDILFIPPDRRANIRTPDIVMDGFYWEIKSPVGRSPRTLENNLRNALHQSPNIIVDIRRMDAKIPEDKIILTVKRRFLLTKKMQRVIIITKRRNLIDLRR